MACDDDQWDAPAMPLGTRHARTQPTPLHGGCSVPITAVSLRSPNGPRRTRGPQALDGSFKDAAFSTEIHCRRLGGNDGDAASHWIEFHCSIGLIGTIECRLAGEGQGVCARLGKSELMIMTRLEFRNGLRQLWRLIRIRRRHQAIHVFGRRQTIGPCARNYCSCRVRCSARRARVCRLSRVSNFRDPHWCAGDAYRRSIRRRHRIRPALP